MAKTKKTLYLCTLNNIFIHNLISNEMKNLKLLFAVAIMAALFTNCKHEVSSVELNKTVFVMETNEQSFLTATVLPEKADQSVLWRSSDVNVVSVDKNGKLTAVKLGDATITAEAGDKSATCKVYVSTKIGGVFWAASNVDAFGKFAPTKESAGMFYQWNRPTAWNATGDVTEWNGTTPSGNTWVVANDPCPDGWRVPTYDELRSLLIAGSKWTTKGRNFGTAPNQIFLPAPGYREKIDGKLKNKDTEGYYWGNAEWEYGANEATGLHFTDLLQDGFAEYKSYGYSVRCVAK